MGVILSLVERRSRDTQMILRYLLGEDQAGLVRGAVLTWKGLDGAEQTLTSGCFAASLADAASAAVRAGWRLSHALEGGP